MEARHQGIQVVVLEVLRIPTSYPSDGDPQQQTARLTHHVASHLLQLSSPLGVIIVQVLNSWLTLSQVLSMNAESKVPWTSLTERQILMRGRRR